jgi:hypothetical protein
MEEGSILRSHLMPGQLVSVTFDKALLEDVEFSTAPIRKDHHLFFERIRLSSWPGWNDFFGSTIKVIEGDSAIIVQKLGRPFQICEHPRWAIYDVYEIMIDNRICQAFRCNLIPVLPTLHLLE